MSGACRFQKMILLSIFFVIWVSGISLATELGVIEALQPVSNTYPRLSPDGSSLLYSANSAGSLNIYLLNIDTKEVKTLTSTQYDDSSAAWSPDGNRIAFQREDDTGERDIWIMNKDGSQAEKVTNSPSSCQHPRFSQDQKHVIFDSNRDDSGDDDSSRSQNYEIYQLSLESGEIQRLTDWDEWDMYGSLSPDGQKLVWRRAITDEDGKRNFEIFTKDLSTGVETNLSNCPAVDIDPHWSPTGDYIVFASNRGPDSRRLTDLFVIKPDGSDLRRVTDGGGQIMGFLRPTFTADGQKVTANRMVRGVTDMVLVDLQPVLQD